MMQYILYGLAERRMYYQKIRRLQPSSISFYMKESVCDVGFRETKKISYTNA